MWGSFLWAALVALLLLYGPGYLLFRGMRFLRALALFCAPLYSVFVFASLPIIYYGLGIGCNILTIAVPTLAVAALVFGVSRTSKYRKPDQLVLSQKEPLRLFGRTIPFDLAAPVFYVTIATLLCVLVFVLALPEAGAIATRHDNITHLNLARSFLDSGKWSSLHPSTFLASPPYAQSIANEPGFYPSAWTCLVVLTSLVSGSDLMVCVNAIVAISMCVVFPLGAYAFMRVLLPSRRRTILMGGIAMMGFVNWPWSYIFTGPLYPNQLGISLQVCAMAALMALIEHGELTKHVPSFAVSCLVSFGALALTHPTTLFSAYVFMAWYGVHVIWNSLYGWRRIGVLAGYTFVIISFWVTCYQLPMLRSVIGYTETECVGFLEAITGLFSIQYADSNIQFGMILCVAMGCVALFKQKKRRWFLLPVLFFFLGYLATRMDVWFAKHWLSALWYSDKRRMVVNMSLYLMPIVALGLNAILPHRVSSSPQPRLHSARRVAFVLLVVSIYLPCLPMPLMEQPVELPFGQAASLVRERYEEEIFPTEEIDFVKRALEVIPPDSLIINVPNDGSVWAYGATGMNTYYRNIYAQGLTYDANVIRTSLCYYAQSETVQEAVRHTGATYVLMLDKGVPYKYGSWLWQYYDWHEPRWRGIGAINDHTPGFSIVLAEGDDMRLYKICDP